MRLYIARHGQTDANAQHRYLGSLDPELNVAGRAQAVNLRLELPSSINAIVVSPLLRARQTAEIINGHLNLPLHIIDSFRERNVGVFEGLTQTEARHRYPDLWAQNITRQWHLAPPDGESVAQTFTRAHRGLVQLIESSGSENLLLVAHGFIAKSLRALVRRDFSDFYDWQLNNGQLLELDGIETVRDYIVPFQDPLPISHSSGA